MMQYTTFFDRKKALPANSRSLQTAGRGVLLWGVKGLVLCLMLYFVMIKVRQGHLSFEQLWLLGKGMYASHPWYLWLVPLLLVVANWGFEARKWQVLASPVSPLSMVQATRAVLTGLTLGFITPRSVGDYAGRIIEAPGKERTRLIGAVLLNRLSQSFITFFFGLLGLWGIYSSSSPAGTLHFNQVWIFFLILLAPLAMLLLFGNARFRLINIVERYTGKKISKTLDILGEYTQKDIYRVLTYALLRYMVFTVQFILILQWAGVQLPILFLGAGVASVFLLKSVIPAFNFLSDLGVREFSALWVFSFFEVPESQLITASLLVWCLNILLPTLVGGINILRLRLNRFG